MFLNRLTIWLSDSGVLARLHFFDYRATFKNALLAERRSRCPLV
jgi:hypothetical protein